MKRKNIINFNLLLLVILTFLSLLVTGAASWNVSNKIGFSGIKLEPVCYNKNTGLEYFSIETAVEKAKENQQIFVKPKTNIHISKNITLKDNISLILPYEGENYNGIGKGTSSDGSFADSEDKYLSNLKCNVTLDKNVSITLEGGKLLIGGILGNAGANVSGQTTGFYSQITMESNAKIVMNPKYSSNIIECYGYIKESTKNNGSEVIANSGSISMPFVVYDFRGGSNTSSVYMKNISPFNVYDMPNITSLMTISSKAKLIGFADLYAGNKHNTTNVTIIQKGTALIQLSNESSYATIKVNVSNPLVGAKTPMYEKNNFTELNLYNGASLGTLKMTIKLSDNAFIGALTKIDIDTSKVFFPISYKYRINLHRGTYSNKNKLKVMTGCTLVVDEDAVLTVEKPMIVYSNFKDADGAVNRYPDLSSGKLIVNGNMNINNQFGGFVQTENTKKIDINLNVSSATLSVSSDEMYDVQNANLKWSVTEAARAKVLEKSSQTTNIENVTRTLYLSNARTDFYIKGDDLGKYTIVYNAGEGTINGEKNISVEYPILKNQSVTLNNFASEEPYLKYYNFIKWVKEDGTDANGIVVRDGDTIYLNATYELAEYNIYYYIEYKDDVQETGYVLNAPQTYNKNSFVNGFLTIDKPVDKNNIPFNGRYLNNSKNKVNGFSIDDGGADIILTGFFTNDIYYLVSFVDTGTGDCVIDSTKLIDIEVKKGQTISLPTAEQINGDSTKNKYLNDVWFIGNNKDQPFTSTSKVENNLILYSSWCDKSVVTYFDLNNQKVHEEFYVPGTNALSKRGNELGVTQEYNDAEDFNQAHINKHIFDGWTIEGLTSKIDEESMFLVNDNVNLHAHYAQTVYKYKVKIINESDVYLRNPSIKVNFSSYGFTDEITKGTKDLFILNGDTISSITVSKTDAGAWPGKDRKANVEITCKNGTLFNGSMMNGNYTWNNLNIAINCDDVCVRFYTT